MRIMREISISERVEVLLARTAAMLENEEIATSFSDRLAIEILADDTTDAHRILHSLAGEHGVMTIMRRIIGGIIEDARGESLTPECHYGDICITLEAMLAPSTLTTAHLLYAIAMDTTTHTSEALHDYGINAEDIRRELGRNVVRDVEDGAVEASDMRSTPKIIEEHSMDRVGAVEHHVRTLLDALGHKRCVVIVVGDSPTDKVA